MLGLVGSHLAMVGLRPATEALAGALLAPFKAVAEKVCAETVLLWEQLGPLGLDLDTGYTYRVYVLECVTPDGKLCWYSLVRI